MNTITLSQPWAALVTLGIKTVDTKAWSTNYRGRLVIHAGKRQPDVEMLEDGPAGVLFGESRPDDPVVAKWWRTERADYSPEDRWSLWTPLHGITPMPLGQIVATCELVDVVPMLAMTSRQPVSGGWMRVGETTLGVNRGGSNDHFEFVTNQRPYGDFRPGRFAWLLADIKPTTERCPACWGSGSYPYPLRRVCRVCHGKLSCEPIQVTGREPWWEWLP